MFTPEPDAAVMDRKTRPFVWERKPYACRWAQAADTPTPLRVARPGRLYNAAPVNRDRGPDQVPRLDYRFRAVLRFARGATNFVTLLRAADAAFFNSLRFTTIVVAAPTTNALAIAERNLTI